MKLGNSTKLRVILAFVSLLTLFSIGIIVPVRADATGDLVITGVVDGPLTGGIPKAIELYVVNNIADLGIYGLGSANNGGGTDGEEFTFPAVSATAGDFIYIASELTGFTSFFGFAPDYTSGAASINGDDAIELFLNSSVVDVFGDINVDGSGQPWEYLDGWAYRVDGTGQDGTTFVLANWTFSGINALDGETTNATAATPFPIGAYSPSTAGPELDFGDAPDPLVATAGEYPTLLANNGARHTIVPGFFLGASVDGEADGQPNATATGDDTDGNDDEDGVAFDSAIQASQTATVTLTASAGGLLNAWIDFDADGNFEVGEQIFTDQALAAGANQLTFAVPAGIASGNSYARFRFNTAGGLSADGLAADGEVEDYGVWLGALPTGAITAHKFEDLNGNGVLDAGEPALSGWTMSLYSGSSCVDPVLGSGITDGAGNVTFSNLPAGDYSVAETLQAGWQNTTGICQDVTLAAGGSETVNFGNQELPPVVVVNEVDVDQAGTDTQEFIELYDGGVGNTSLAGLVLVLINGSDDASYTPVFDLDGFSTDANGYFVVGGAAVPNVDLVQPTDSWLQNGADAVALYLGNDTDFPNDTPVTTSNLVDAIVYDTDDGDDAGLLVLLNAGQPQVNERDGGDGTAHSNQRCPNGTGGARNTDTYAQFVPTPGAANLCGVSVAQLLLSEIVVTPTGGEFIEIYNPGAAAVDLTDVYLTDATFAGGGTYYYNIVTESNAGGGGYSDFHARFPAGASIGPDEYQTIALAGSDAFFTEYGVNPTYELFEDGGTADAIPDMREALAGSINNQGGLTNGGEVVILYYWDGAGDLVTDLDYVVWGDTAEAVDKTGVSIDGPDADVITSTYLNDTALALQDLVANAAHASDNSWQRDDLTEGAEIKTGGNGADGHNETSEDLSNTWCENTPTPGATSDCPAAMVINEIHADPAGDLTGDANSDGVRDGSDDEFVEIVNNSDSDLDISGWTVADGFSVRHTFPAGTMVPVHCAVVVFGGGTPTGSFGNTVVMTATTGALGLNNGGDTITLNDGVSDQVVVVYGAEGGNDQSLTLDPDITGSSYVSHTLATNSGGTLFSPGTMIDGSFFSGCPACGSSATLIHVIQGNGPLSLEDGNTHVIEGVVVGDFQTSDFLRGFFLQEEDSDADADPATSEGIFVYDGSTPAVDVSVGDVVRVTGTVDEYYDLTELTSVTSVEVCSISGSATAATITLPVPSLDLWEQYEGMLINIPHTLYATGNYYQGRYGEVDLSAGDRLANPTNVVPPGAPANALQELNDRSRIQLEDGRTSQNPVPAPYMGISNTLRAGDTLPELTGVLHYAYGSYEVHPTGVVSFTRVNARDAAPPAVGGSLKVASFNVLNYFVTIDDSGAICGPTGGMDCRGADTAEEFTRQRDKIISAIVAIDADVIGLMELENHPTDAALQDLVSGLNDAAGAATYARIITGTIGTDAIKVAFIYKLGTVTPVGVPAILDSSVDPTFIDTKNRPALAQTFEENATGERFTAAVNHLKSKGSDCDALGDPDTGDGQGNCNLTRTAAATALVNWLAGDPTGSNDADLLIIGDLNAYAMEDPIAAITGAGYTNLIESFIGMDAYSYVFMGQAGYLDHALGSSTLTSQVTGVVEWHINADEPSALNYNDYNQPDLYNPDPYVASDHDPVIVGLDLRPYYVYLPLALNNYVLAPDLAVQSLVATNDDVTVVIMNQGNAPTANDFWIDLYIDPDTAPSGVNQLWSDLGTQGIVWGVTFSLDPGEMLTLTVDGPYYQPAYSVVNWPLPAGTQVYVQLDSYDAESSYGAVLEDHEIIGGPYNNIANTVSVAS